MTKASVTATDTQPTTAAGPLHLIIGTYLGSPEEIARVTPEHRAWLDNHYRSGVLLASGRQNPPTGSVLLARNSSREGLEAMMQTDPFMLAGLASYQVTEFTPVKRSADFPYPSIPAVE